MRIGLVTDIHNHVSRLWHALSTLREKGCDRYLTLGDSCDVFAANGGEEGIVDLFEEYSVEGVWGNHDFPLCRDVTEKHRARYPKKVLDAMSRMQPTLEIDGYFFSHREASIDHSDIGSLWSIDEGDRDLSATAKQGFDAVTHRRMLHGHYHQWWASTPEGVVDWSGQQPLRFEPDQRYFVVLASVMDGCCAVLDTDEGTLYPIG